MAKAREQEADTRRPAELSTLGQIEHIGYVVDDIPRAVSFWVEAMGAGPFFLIEHMAFDELYHANAVPVFDHSAAFGQWGPIAVELTQIHEISPRETLGAKLAPHPNSPNHVGYCVRDPIKESARLERLGAPKFLVGKVGEVEVTLHDAPWLGHAVELHAETEFIRRFFADVASAAEDWDGVDPLRMA